MKQFNLEEYLKNPSRKVVTRDGRNVRIRCTDRKNKCYPIVALIESVGGEEEDILCYPRNGEYPTCKEIDLFFAPEKHERWTPVYRLSAGKISFGFAYSTQKEAEEASKCDVRYITTTKVEWEE